MVIDIYGLSGLAKIGRLRQRAQRRTLLCIRSRGLWLNGIATNSRMSGDALKYPEQAAKANPINYVLAAALPF